MQVLCVQVFCSALGIHGELISALERFTKQWGLCLHRRTSGCPSLGIYEKCQYGSTKEMEGKRKQLFLSRCLQLSWMGPVCVIGYGLQPWGSGGKQASAVYYLGSRIKLDCTLTVKGEMGPFITDTHTFIRHKHCPGATYQLEQPTLRPT